MRADEAWRGLYPLATAADDDWTVAMDYDQDRPKLPTSVFTKKKKKKMFASLAVSCHQDVSTAQVSGNFTPLVLDLNFSYV